MSDSPRDVLALPDFRLFVVARFISVVALQMQSVAIGWQMYDLTGRALDLGYVGLAQFLPNVCFSLIGGHTADRYDRRAVLLVCFLAQSLTALFLFGYVHHGATATAPIYCALAVMGILRAFRGPVQQALLPDLVPGARFRQAVTINSSIFQLATIAGPSIGGLMYAVAKRPSPVYALAAALSAGAFALTALVTLRTGRMEKEQVSLRTVLAGFGYVWSRRDLLGSISLDLFAVLFGGAVALLPIFARDILHVGPSGLGLLRSAPAFGAASMALLLAHRPVIRNNGPIMLWCVVLFGVATIVFGLSTSFALSLVALAVLGAADNVSVVVRLSLEQLRTPPAMRGRVSAVNSMFIGASNELGDFESGLTAAWWGAVRAVVYGGIGTIAVVAIWSLLFPELRTLDRLTPADDDVPEG